MQVAFDERHNTPIEAEIVAAEYARAQNRLERRGEVSFKYAAHAWAWAAQAAGMLADVVDPALFFATPARETLPTITLQEVKDRTPAGPRFGPETRVGWLVALNEKGEVVMAGGKPAEGIVRVNALGNGYELRRVVAATGPVCKRCASCVGCA